ncbi:MAG: glycosyltransferase, partial [Acidobacteriota bacterium]
TVSPTYARQIVWPEQGHGLDQQLRARGADLSGILNGLDVEKWNPARDPLIPTRFTAEDLAGKRECKAVLQRELGLREQADLPLFGLVSRVDHQKGIDLVGGVAPFLVEQGAQLVVLGSGQRALLEPLQSLARAWRQSVAVSEGVDDQLAHRIYAGSDFFLMPSRFEPCGLGQMIALRYGTIPLVHRTGGLADTVTDVDESPDRGNGLVFDVPDAAGLRWASERALTIFRDDRGRLEPIRQRAMRVDFSWDHSASAYDRVLSRAVAVERRRVLS